MPADAHPDPHATVEIATVPQLVREIHNAGLQLVLALTGGGSRAVSALLEVPGASRSVIEATIPYSSESLAAWLGAVPEHYCSQRTARSMAMAGYQRAVRLTSARMPIPQVAGVACTASLATDRIKRGSHRLHLAVQTRSETWARSLVLVKGARSRDEEEHVVVSLVLNMIAERCGIAARLMVPLLPAETLEQTDAVAPRAWQDLLAGRLPAVSQGPVVAGSTARAIFPGAFNPRHEGHQRMAEVARRLLGAAVEHEISTVNVDKPPLDFVEMSQRAGQFSQSEALWFTRAPTFVEKSRIFPGAWFLVGVDTIVRIAEPRYYDDDPQACAAALAEIAAQGCKFLVFGRSTADGFQTLESLRLPPTLADICQGVPADEFRADVSSTELRSRNAADE
jgi:nicotinamide mononucleotide (NMN) deamidase PncC